MRFLWPAIALCASWWVIARCAGESDASTISAVAQWPLSQQPVLDIGVESGDPVYELTDASSSLRLPDGTVVVADAGVGELRYFDGEGRFRFATGGDAAEVNAPIGGGRRRGLLRPLHSNPHAGISYESAGRRYLFDNAGTLVSVESNTQSASRIHGRNLIVGGSAAAQERAIGTLERLSAVDSVAGYRIVRLDDAGYLWIEQPIADARLRRPWEIFTPDAQLIGRAMTPASFEPHQIGDGFILGRWRDGNGIEHIRMYDLTRDERVAPGSEAAAGSPGARRTVDAATEREVTSVLRRTLIAAARLQESHWSSSMRYASETKDLGLELPAGVGVSMVSAGVGGWRALAYNYAADIMCGIGVGRDTPVGWEDGVPVCK
jgi:hypothetical protein